MHLYIVVGSMWPIVGFFNQADAVQISHCLFVVLLVFAHMCLFMWRARWSDRENARSHKWHWNGRCPVCFRKWRVSSSERANFQPQPSQLQWYGFSPKNTKNNHQWQHSSWRSWITCLPHSACRSYLCESWGAPSGESSSCRSFHSRWKYRCVSRFASSARTCDPSLAWCP